MQKIKPVCKLLTVRWKFLTEEEWRKLIEDIPADIEIVITQLVDSPTEATYIANLGHSLLYIAILRSLTTVLQILFSQSTASQLRCCLQMCAWFARECLSQTNSKTTTPMLLST